MKLVIGIDTGGTYTDAVILDRTSGLVSRKAKALTTSNDLSVGIAQAIDGLGSVDFNEVKMVSISTTLATNAIVEGHGGRVGLLLIGYDQELMEEKGLAKRLPVEMMVYISGGHDVKGDEMNPLDFEAARQAILEMKDQVEAFAVSAYFSVMNPDHEIQVRNLIHELTSSPVVCGHEITNKLNALKRVSTVVLNARLLPLIRHLLDSVIKVLQAKGCDAPLMVVRGDGTLISEGMARERPVETILSGPAASAIGAQFLANVSDGIVVDMGGTTTDIAILQNGLPWSNPSGATVGGWQTCVKAADLQTIGLGGDSYIQVEDNDVLKIGPQRAIPLMRLGAQYPEICFELANPQQLDIRRDDLQLTDYFTLANTLNGLSLHHSESKIIAALKKRPLSIIELRKFLGDRLLQTERLEMLGVIRRAGLTPTDVLWEESTQDGCNELAAQLGTQVFAQRMDMPLDDFIEYVREIVIVRIAGEIIDKLFSNSTSQSLNTTPFPYRKLLQSLLGAGSIPDFSGFLKVHKPIIAIGGPVACFLPRVAERLHTRCIIPPHAEVGNAVGASVASNTHTVEILVQPHVVGSGTIKYLVHTPLERLEFSNLEQAVMHAELLAKEFAKQKVLDSGGTSPSVTLDRHELKMGMLSEVTIRASATEETNKLIHK